jgi:hypothetical protein
MAIFSPSVSITNPRGARFHKPVIVRDATYRDLERIVAHIVGVSEHEVRLNLTNLG